MSLSKITCSVYLKKKKGRDKKSFDCFSFYPLNKFFSLNSGLSRLNFSQSGNRPIISKTSSQLFVFGNNFRFKSRFFWQSNYLTMPCHKNFCCFHRNSPQKL